MGQARLLCGGFHRSVKSRYPSFRHSGAQECPGSCKGQGICLHLPEPEGWQTAASFLPCCRKGKTLGPPKPLLIPAGTAHL